jgi:hypothetical protein
MCSFVVTHFSTFGVGDSDIIATKPPASPRAENDTQSIIGPVVGGVVGGIVLISIIAFFVVKMKSGKVQASEAKTAVHDLIAADAGDIDPLQQLEKPKVLHQQHIDQEKSQQEQQQISVYNSAIAGLKQQKEMMELDNQQQQ